MERLSVQEWNDRVSNLFRRHVRLGLANIGGLYSHEPPTLGSAKELIAAALQFGIRRFDTAPLYGYRLSEKMFGRCRASVELGDALTAARIDVSTKVLRSIVLRNGVLDSTQPAFWELPEPHRSAVEVWAVTPSDIGSQLFESLNLLGLTAIDGVALHDVADAIQETATTKQPLSVEQIIPTIDFLREQKALGRLAHIGIAEKSDQLATTLLLRCPKAFGYCMTTTYTLAAHNHALRSTLPTCVEQRVPFRAASPYLSRILVQDPRKARKVTGRDDRAAYYFDPNTRRDLVTWNYREITEEEITRARRIWDIAEQTGEMSPRAAAAHFCLAHPAVEELVIGAATPAHLESLAADFAKPIRGEFFYGLQRAGLLHPDAPLPPVLA